MRILHTIPSVSPVRGGPSHAIFGIVTALRQRNITAEVITTTDDGDNLLDVPTNQFIEFKEVPTCFFPKAFPDNHSIREFSFSVPFTNWLWQNIHNYDLVHVHGGFSYTSTIAMALARMKGIPYVNRPPRHLGQWSRNQKKLKKAIYWQLMERSNISHANALHLTAQDEVDELPDLPEKVIRAIIPHGITPPTLNHNARQQLCQQYQIDDADFIILYLSRIHPKKGIDLLIRSLAQINQGNETKRNFTLILGGSGDARYQAEITALIERYNLGSKVRQVGFLSGTAKDLALQGADLFALTSYAENFGVVVLESLAAGTPVLLSKGVALSKFVAQEGLGYICDVDVSSIYEQLVLAMTERRKATQPERINQAIAVTQGNYAWSNIAQQLENLYCEIISSNILGSRSGNTSTK